jgi:3-oxoadipate enol-lactonase
VEKAQVNGTTIAYEVVGSGEPLLLIHGAGVSHTEFQPQYEALGARYRLIMPDVRGHGESGQTPEPYSIKLFADDMFGLLDKLGIEQTLICGHSMGGAIAQQMAVDQPKRVRAAVLAETNYGFGDNKLLKLFIPVGTWMTKLMGMERAKNMTVRQMKLSPEAAAIFEEGFRVQMKNPDNFWNLSEANYQFDGKGQLSRIGCPTLILIAENNKVTHGMGRTMEKLIPGAKLSMIPKAGHMLNWDNTNGFNRAVLEFFAAVS